MGAISRKDYGAAAVVPENNPALKEQNAINSPFSIQAMGLKTNTPPQMYVQAYAETAVGQRVLYGNCEGRITTRTGSQITVKVFLPNDTTIDKVYLAAEVDATNDFYIEKSNYVAQTAKASVLSITAKAVRVEVGGTVQVVVIGKYADGREADVTASATFVSGTPANATVGASTGIVTGVLEGTSTITVTLIATTGTNRTTTAIATVVAAT